MSINHKESYIESKKLKVASPTTYLDVTSQLDRSQDAQYKTRKELASKINRKL